MRKRLPGQKAKEEKGDMFVINSVTYHIKIRNQTHGCHHRQATTRNLSCQNQISNSCAENAWKVLAMSVMTHQSVPASIYSQQWTSRAKENPRPEGQRGKRCFVCATVRNLSCQNQIPNSCAEYACKLQARSMMTHQSSPASIYQRRWYGCDVQRNVSHQNQNPNPWMPSQASNNA